ncbi:hypothetical protein M413DRAFT_230230 [Hebeloma cylindrosporum]|uniref:Uncharacterized protein n=1 Tax=Hebeloma cylindrosporum TaxID=76867 RepID=A0A0C2YF19_HEBCY|nr:hypothetical protein M413DRAFT_230230 [Hebeloma cylindrosporum h7]
MLTKNLQMWCTRSSMVGNGMGVPSYHTIQVEIKCKSIERDREGEMVKQRQERIEIGNAMKGC